MRQTARGMHGIIACSRAYIVVGHMGMWVFYGGKVLPVVSVWAKKPTLADATVCPALNVFLYRLTDSYNCGGGCFISKVSITTK